MAITFPNSPSSGDTHTTSNGLQYTYDGEKWTTIGTNSAGTWTRSGTTVSLTTAGDDLNVDSGTLFVDASTDRVGVGTASPTTNLEINGGTNNNIVRIVSTDANANIEFADNTTTSGCQIGANGDNLKFGISGTEAMRIDSSSRLLVGTTAGAYKLVVSGGVATTGIVASILNPVSGGNSKIHFSDNATYNWTAGTVGNAFAITPTEASTSAGTPALFINSSGNLGIGTTSPSEKLTVAGDGSFSGGIRATGNNSGSWSSGSGLEILNAGINAYNRTTSAYIAASINTLNWTLNSDGNATFAGSLQAGGSPLNGVAQGTTIGSYGSVNAARTTGSNSVFNGFTVGTSTPTSSILANGSATFAGNVNCSSDGNNTASLVSAGYVLANRTSGSASVFSGQLNGSQKAGITADGNATFAGIVSGIRFTNATDSYDPWLKGVNSSGIETFNVSKAGNIFSSGRLLLGTTTEGAPAADNLTLQDSGSCGLTIRAGTSDYSTIYLSSATSGAGEYAGSLQYGHADNSLRIGTNSVERMRIDSSGNCLFGTTTNGSTATGTVIRPFGETLMTRSSGPSLLINRTSSDGGLIDFRQDNTSEGSINVSGSTVSLIGAHLSRWSQLANGAARTEILRGSVLSNLDEMCEWGEEDNEQLNRMKVSDVEGDKNVSGVFQAWDDDDDTYTNDFYCAMTGDFVIRIAQGTTVARGDLLMSAGDGTAKPQDDDIVRSKTIAKVTSTIVSTTYSDNSYCVPCVLMAC